MLRLHQIFILVTLYLNFGLLEGLPIANETQREVLRKLYHKLRVDVEDFGLALNFTDNIRPDESEIREGTSSDWSFRGVVDAIIGREQTDQQKNGAAGKSETEQTKAHGVSETINDIIQNLNEVREIVVGNCSESENRDQEVKTNQRKVEFSQKNDNSEENINSERQENENRKSLSALSVSNEEGQDSNEGSEAKNAAGAGTSGEQSADSSQDRIVVTSTPESESGDDRDNLTDVTAENSESSDDSSEDSDDDSSATTATPSSEEGGSEGEEDEETEVTTTEWPFRVSFREIGAHLGLLGKFPKPPANEKEAMGTTERSVTTAIYSLVDNIKSSLGYGPKEGDKEIETSIKAAGMENDDTSEKAVMETPDEITDKSNLEEEDENTGGEKQINSPENSSATKTTTENSNESEIGAGNDGEGADDLREQEGTTEKNELTTAVNSIESDFLKPIHTTSTAHETAALAEKVESSDDENSSSQNKGEHEHHWPVAAEDGNIGLKSPEDESAENSKGKSVTELSEIAVDLAVEDDKNSSGDAESDEEGTALGKTNAPPHKEFGAIDIDSSVVLNSSDNQQIGASVLSGANDGESQISDNAAIEGIKSNEETDNNLDGDDSIADVPELSTISPSAINSVEEISKIGISSLETDDGISLEIATEGPELEEKYEEQSEVEDKNNVPNLNNGDDDGIAKKKSTVENQEEFEEQKSFTTETNVELHSSAQETTITPINQLQETAIFDSTTDTQHPENSKPLSSEGEEIIIEKIDVSEEDQEILETIPEETDADLTRWNKNDYTGEILTPEIIMAEKERAALEETNLTGAEDEREETKSSERNKGRDTIDDLILLVGTDDVENEQSATEATKLETEAPQEETEDKLADLGSRRVITHSEEMEYLEKTQSLDKGQSSYPNYDSIDDEEKAVFGDTISRIKTIPVRVKDIFEELREKQKELHNENAPENEEKSAVGEIKDEVGAAFGKVSTWLEEKSDGQKQDEDGEEDEGIFGGIISEVGTVVEKAKDAIDELLEMKKVDEEEKAQTKEIRLEADGVEKILENTVTEKNDGGYGSWFKQITDFVEKETESSNEQKETAEEGTSSTDSSTAPPEGEESLAGVIKSNVNSATDKVVSWLQGKSEDKKESSENASAPGIIETSKNSLENGGPVVELAEGEEKDTSGLLNNEEEKVKSEEKSDGGFGSWFKHVTEAIKNETKALGDSKEDNESENKSLDEIVNPTQETAETTEETPELEVQPEAPPILNAPIEEIKADEEEQESEERSVLSVITTSVDSAVDKVTSWFGDNSEEKKESNERGHDFDKAGILGGIISAAEKAYEREVDAAEQTPDILKIGQIEHINNNSMEVNETIVDPEEEAHLFVDKNVEPIVNLIASSDFEEPNDNFTIGIIHYAENEAANVEEKVDEVIEETVPVQTDDAVETDNNKSETSDVQEIGIISAQSNEDENVPTYDDTSAGLAPIIIIEKQNVASEIVEKNSQGVESANENFNETSASQEDNEREEILAPVLPPETAENESTLDEEGGLVNSESGLGLVPKGDESGPKSEESVITPSENINNTDHSVLIGAEVGEEKAEIAEQEGGQNGLIPEAAEEVEAELQYENKDPGQVEEHIVNYDYDDVKGAVVESKHGGDAAEVNESGLGLTNQLAEAEGEEKSEEVGQVDRGLIGHAADYVELEKEIQTTDVHGDDGEEVEVHKPLPVEEGVAGSEQIKIEVPKPPVEEADSEETENVKYEHNLGSNLISPGTDNVEPSMLSMKQFHDNKGNPEPRVNVTFNAPKLKGVYDMYIDRKGRRCSEFTELPLDVEYLREVFVNLGYSNFQLPSLGVNLNELADKAVFFKDLDDNSILCGTLTINHR